MAFPTTLADWRIYVKDFINADDYTDAQIDTFLDLAQTRLNKEMSSYAMEAMFPHTIVGPANVPIDLPTVLADFNKIRLINAVGVGPLDVQAINEIKKTIEGDPASQDDPARYCIDAKKLYIFPWPAVSDVIEIYYYKKIPLLGPGVDSNVFTTDHPDALLFAACLEAAPYQIEDERIPIWENKYVTALAVANNESNRIKMGSTPLRREIKGLS
jgi:hypothetical protein